MSAMLVRYPKLRGVLIRTSAKGHGRQMQIEGDTVGLRTGHHFLMVDDVMTTGASVGQATRLLREHLQRKEMWMRAAVILDRRSRLEVEASWTEDVQEVDAFTSTRDWEYQPA